MSFQAAITSVFQKYVCFSGRAQRRVVLPESHPYRRADYSDHLALRGQPARLEPVRRQPQVPLRRLRRRVRSGRIRPGSLRAGEL